MANKKILLIEDDLFISRAYKDALEQLGYAVMTVASGDEAIRRMPKEKPDLILLDLILPQKDGFEVLREKNQDPDLKGIPVIVITNLGQESDVNLARELGVDAYIVKSNTSMKEVIDLVEQQFHTQPTRPNQ